MIIRLSFLLFLIFFFSCNERSKYHERSVSKFSNEDSLKQSLIGIWGGLNEDSPVWEIRVDSVYYYQKAKTYPYRIVGHNLIIQFPESKGVLENIFVVKDTLFYSVEPGLSIRDYRFKK